MWILGKEDCLAEKGEMVSSRGIGHVFDDNWMEGGRREDVKFNWRLFFSVAISAFGERKRKSKYYPKIFISFIYLLRFNLYDLVWLEIKFKKKGRFLKFII